MIKILNLIFIIVFFSACVKDIPSPEQRKENVLISAQNSGFQEFDMKTSTFSLFSLQKNDSLCSDKNLRIYIEGDGLSWLSRTIISKNPTPLNSTILKLMYEDKSECKVYLARPCQFINSQMCSNKYWTSHRFSTEVIESFDESLNNLRNKYKNKSFTLIGHSGGGAVATILAAKRKDINLLITIAGNIDTEKWTSFHNISKLEGLNPADFSENLENVKQYHLIGTKDKIITKDIFESYISKLKDKSRVYPLYFEEEHNCCWEKSYKNFLEKIEF